MTRRVYQAYVGDDGAPTPLQFRRNGVAFDLTDVQALTINFVKPSGEVGTWEDNAPGLGEINVVRPTDGDIEKIWAATDLDETSTEGVPGEDDVHWLLQIVAVFGAAPACYSDPIELRVGPAVPGDVPVLPTIDALVLHIDAGSGDDANDGLSEGASVQSWERLFDLIPAGFRDSLDVHIHGTDAVVVPDGEWIFPFRVGNAQPMRVIGHYAAWATGIVAEVGFDEDTPESNWIRDTVGGWTVPSFVPEAAASNLYRVRFTSGPAEGTYYSIQANTADQLYLAFTWDNGPAPEPGDTYVIEYPAAVISYNDAQFRARAPVLVTGVNFQALIAGTGSERGPGVVGVRVIQFAEGHFYVPGCFFNTLGGRIWVTGGSLRSFDITENLDSPPNPHGAINPYPSVLGGFEAFGLYGGDLFCDGQASVQGSVNGAYFDEVVVNGGVVELMNEDLLVVNQQDHQNGGIGRYSITRGNRARIRSSSGYPLRVFRGGMVYVKGANMDGSNHGAGLETGGELTMEDCSGTVATGAGVEVYTGASLRTGGGNSVTGPTGDVRVETQHTPQVLTEVDWADVERLGSVTAGLGAIP